MYEGTQSLQGSIHPSWTRSSKIGVGQLAKVDYDYVSERSTPIKRPTLSEKLAIRPSSIN